ncbi:short chain dehydrogenase reductase [Moniliophthora roreri]|nr:short chain dehydrogenase reductase [Moniliophthora roreri]
MVPFSHLDLPHHGQTFTLQEPTFCLSSIMSQRKTVLITGCSAGGIGHALAKEFHEKGLRVFATARRIDSMKELEVLGIETLALDVTDAAAARKIRDEIATQTGGKLDVLKI